MEGAARASIMHTGSQTLAASTYIPCTRFLDLKAGMVAGWGWLCSKALWPLRGVGWRWGVGWEEVENCEDEPEQKPPQSQHEPGLSWRASAGPEFKFRARGHKIKRWRAGIMADRSCMLASHGWALSIMRELPWLAPENHPAPPLRKQLRPRRRRKHSGGNLCVGGVRLGQ